MADADSTESVCDLTPDVALVVVETQGEGTVGLIVPAHRPFDYPKAGREGGNE